MPRSPCYTCICVAPAPCHALISPFSFCQPKGFVHAMCHAGTPLGDPIEVFAALSVLMPQQQQAHPTQPHSSRSPITLTALKSHMGHAEPAAGILGLCRLVHQQQTSSTLPLMHLISPNPFLSPAMELAQTADGDAPLAGLPRQPMPWVNTGAGTVVGGISAFAFQVCEQPFPACRCLRLRPGCVFSLAPMMVYDAACLLGFRVVNLCIVCLDVQAHVRFYASFTCGNYVVFPKLQGTNAHAVCTSVQDEGPAPGLTMPLLGQMLGGPGHDATAKECDLQMSGEQSLMVWQRDRLWVHPR